MARVHLPSDARARAWLRRARSRGDKAWVSSCAPTVSPASHDRAAPQATATTCTGNAFRRAVCADALQERRTAARASRCRIRAVADAFRLPHATSHHSRHGMCRKVTTRRGGCTGRRSNQEWARLKATLLLPAAAGASWTCAPRTLGPCAARGSGGRRSGGRKRSVRAGRGPRAWWADLTPQAPPAAGDRFLGEDGPDAVVPSAIVARRGDGAAGTQRGLRNGAVES